MTTSISNSIDLSVIIAVILALLAVAVAVISLRQLLNNLSARKAIIFSVISLIVICGCIAFIVLTRGERALFAPSAGTGGVVTGEYTESGMHTVRVRENTIYLDGVRVNDTSVLISLLKEFFDDASPEESQVMVADDYALAGTMHDVENALTDAGIRYQESALE